MTPANYIPFIVIGKFFCYMSHLLFDYPIFVNTHSKKGVDNEQTVAKYSHFIKRSVGFNFTEKDPGFVKDVEVQIRFFKSVPMPRDTSVNFAFTEEYSCPPTVIMDSIISGCP